jgi:hypothetical protein
LNTRTYSIARSSAGAEYCPSGPEVGAFGPSPSCRGKEKAIAAPRRRGGPWVRGLLHLQVLLVLVDDAVMPELPEVEQARKIFARCCVGRRVVQCLVEQDFKVFEGVSPDDFAKHLVGQRITGAGRKGKQLWVELEKRPWPLIHLGMSGSFAAIDSSNSIHTAHYVNSKVDASSWPPKFWKFHLQMDDGGRGTVLNHRSRASLPVLERRERATSEPCASIAAYRSH